MVKPLGPTFHRSFPLQRPVLAEYLRAVLETGGVASASRLREVSGLGTMKIPAALGYGKAAGLLNSAGSLSDLGSIVLDYDPSLSTPSSQWLLHSGLSGGSGQAPAYWANAWRLIGIGSHVTRQEIEAVVIGSYPIGLIQTDSAKVSATAFLSTYVNSDGLKDLGLLEKSGTLISGALPRQRPPIGVVAHAIASRWQDLHPDQMTASLDRFLEESRLLDIFRLSRESAEHLLDEVHKRGDIELYRTAPPYQIGRRWNEISEVTKRVFSDVI